MVYEQCLEERNVTLLNVFGRIDKIPSELPTAGTLLNFSSGNSSIDLFMPALQICDLQKELDNVRKLTHNVI